MLTKCMLIGGENPDYARLKCGKLALSLSLLLVNQGVRLHAPQSCLSTPHCPPPTTLMASLPTPLSYVSSIHPSIFYNSGTLL